MGTIVMYVCVIMVLDRADAVQWQGVGWTSDQAAMEEAVKRVNFRRLLLNGYDVEPARAVDSQLLGIVMECLHGVHVVTDSSEGFKR